jgi:RNA polymerase sigma-70 factor (ECF subfamily)
MIDFVGATLVSLPDRSADPDQSEGRTTIRPVDDAEESIDLLYRLHGGQLFGYLVRLTLGDSRLAEDILQETLLRAWLHLQRRPTDVNEFRPWLYTVARRILVDVLRARRTRPPELMTPDLTSLSASDNDIERLIAGLTVRDALRALKPEHRTVLVELYFRGRTPQEVATALGIPVGTVKSRTHYALRALRRYIGD